METQHDLTGEPDEPTGALDDDNPDLPDDAGETGAGDATGASGGLEGGSEPQGEDARHHERPEMSGWWCAVRRRDGWACPGTIRHGSNGRALEQSRPHLSTDLLRLRLKGEPAC
jgi:hypothetical protein